jgi:hypothetical protein
VLRICESGWRHEETPAETWSFDSRSFIISEALGVLETSHTVIIDGILDVELRMISDNWLQVVQDSFQKIMLPYFGHGCFRAALRL